MEDININNFEKEAYKPRTKRTVKRTGIKSLKQRIKNRIRYRKNRFKLKTYNRKYRMRNKNILKRRRQQRNKRKA